MSFSSDVKNELCKIRPSGCCRLAECYGILLFSRTFSKSSISIVTEHEEVALRYSLLLRLVCDVPVIYNSQGAKRELFTVFVKNQVDRIKVLNFFGHGKEQLKTVNKNLINRDCCMGAFIRGTFLSCGSISDPNKDYHVEFTVNDRTLADDLYNIFLQCGLKAKGISRGASSVIYFKESDNIEDLLTSMKATNHTLELMNIKIYKDMRNKVNRLTNCETANISKTVNAAVKQHEAIQILEQTGKLNTLTTELIETAQLRKKHPDLSLNELSKLCGLTKSGLNHRLQKLIKLAGI